MQMFLIIVLIYLPIYFYISFIEFMNFYQYIKTGEYFYPFTTRVRFSIRRNLRGEESYKKFKDRYDQRKVWNHWPYVYFGYGLLVLIVHLYALVFVLLEFQVFLNLVFSSG